MKTYKATIDDIDDLIQIRLDFIQMEHGSLPEKERIIIYNQCRTYFTKHIPLTNFIAVIGKIDNEIASAAFLAIQEKPASPSCMTGIAGTLWNVITYPQHRKKGLATQIIRALICEARNMNISAIDLNATESGKTVYEKLGFKPADYSSMRLMLQ